MATSPAVPTTTVLGKRKAPESYVLHLSASSDVDLDVSSFSESDYGSHHLNAQSSVPAAGLSRITAKTKKLYQCSFEGCSKAYTKPSRLQEHERSHTGQRPFVCSTCDKSYLRESHLQAHRRTHLPRSERPLACEEPGCDKRFWTAQHLKVHQDVIHKGERPFKCTSCADAFLKHHQLRAHLATAHAPPGTKPYQCEHGECVRSFDTNQKLRAHLKVHDEKRYRCVLAACITAAQPTHFPTWTALQHHIRTDHPPTCPHAACDGRAFTSHNGLRAHLKLHDERVVQDAMDGEAEGRDSDDEDVETETAPPRKRQRGGDVGRDWKCEEKGCEKHFKSKKALGTHHAITHLGRRDFVCPQAECGRAFGYKHLLQRHVARLHGSDLAGPSSEAHGQAHDSDADAEASGTDTEARKGKVMDIDAMTGRAYSKRAAAGATDRMLQCPYPEMHGLDVELPPLNEGVLGESLREPCDYVFGRAYDLRRHLRAAHEVELEKEMVDGWARNVRRQRRSS